MNESKLISKTEIFYHHKIAIIETMKVKHLICGAHDPSKFFSLLEDENQKSFIVILNFFILLFEHNST